MERKGFGIRLGAVIIDGVIIMIAYFILNAIFGVRMNVTNGSFEEMMAAASKVASRSNLFFGLLGLSMATVEVLRAQTPGKMLLKMHIGSAAGGPAARPQLIKRASLKYGVWAFYLLSGITGVLAISFVGMLIGFVYLGGAFAALGQAKQALHDMLGGTAVFGQAGTVLAGFQPVMPPGGSPPPPGAPPAV